VPVHRMTNFQSLFYGKTPDQLNKSREDSDKPKSLRFSLAKAKHSAESTSDQVQSIQN